MASPDLINRWLDTLIRQTTFNNVQWTERSSGNAFVFEGKESVVVLETRDGDDALPYLLSIGGLDGRIQDLWVIYGPDAGERGDAAPEWVASRARTLWGAVQAQTGMDAIQNMLDELDDLPPF